MHTPASASEAPHASRCAFCVRALKLRIEIDQAFVLRLFGRNMLVVGFVLRPFLWVMYLMDSSCGWSGVSRAELNLGKAVHAIPPKLFEGFTAQGVGHAP